MASFLKKIFDVSRRELKRINKMADQIDALGPEMEKLSDEALRAKTDEFKERLAKGETLDDLLIEAFAVVREAARRTIGLYPFKVQLMGGIVLHEGNVAEMKTGEGKTLTATMPVYLNALTGKGVHVVTVNDYLAERDATEMGPIYEFLGLTVGLNVPGMSREEKQKAYQCDVTYGTNNEFGFDYLRDNMVLYKEHMVQRPLHYAIVDEVDSILIDEARTPLIISGSMKKSSQLYLQADAFAKRLREGEDYTIDLKSKSIQLTEAGIDKAERFFSIDNLFDVNNVTINHHISQALRANYIMQRDVDYIVQDGEVVIVDQFTGRLMKGRRYSDGLHQAIEAKEGVPIQQESLTLATITFQNYFRMYRKLAGMTGTAKTEEEEFQNIYNMNVIVIPTNKPMIREDRPDLIYRTMEGKFRAVVNDIEERHRRGQPVLVGTVSVETSELLSKMLKKRGIPHNVLNAKNHAREAEIIAQAGQKGAVTIATNMAGRGTDIKLGEGVRELGGLAVIGTERHESRRIDNQLRGRSGRQGDPGVSQFYLSMEDELMRRFGSESMEGMMDRLGMDDSQPIQSKMVSRAVESAQKQVEGNNYDARKQLLEYDNVINQQREIIYKQRYEVLDSENLREIIEGMIESVLDRNLPHFIPEDEKESEWNLQGLVQFLEANLLRPGDLTVEDFQGKSADEIRTMILAKVKENYDEKEQQLGPERMREFEKVITLRAVDSKWIDHLSMMDQLRQGIHLRAYGQIDPLQEYQREGFEMFEAMVAAIEDEVAKFIMKAEIVDNLKREEVAKGVAVIPGSGGEQPKRKPIRRGEKIGRNEPCPCGSGKKYKHCHGRYAV